MKVLVVGFGSIAKKHLHNLRQLYPNVRLAVWCRPGKVRDSQGLEALFHQVDEVLAWQPDYVVVASPATLHTEHVVALAGLRVPMLVEKPLASNLMEGQRLLTALQGPCLLGYQLRFTDGFLQLREWLPELGALHLVRLEVGQYLPDWRPDTPIADMVSANPELGGGALLELSHELDLVSHLIGLPTRLYAAEAPASHLKLAVEECVELTLHYAQGPLVQVHLDMLQFKPCRQSKWLGEKGQIEWDMLQNRLCWYDAHGALVQQMQGQSTPQQVAQRQLQAWIEQHPGVATATQGLNALRIVDAARLSMQSGCEVMVDA
jgi:predicted dehydrogenase